MLNKKLRNRIKARIDPTSTYTYYKIHFTPHFRHESVNKKKRIGGTDYKITLNVVQFTYTAMRVQGKLLSITEFPVNVRRLNRLRH